MSKHQGYKSAKPVTPREMGGQHVINCTKQRFTCPKVYDWTKAAVRRDFVGMYCMGGEL